MRQWMGEQDPPKQRQSLKIPFCNPEAHINPSIIELIHKNQEHIDVSGINISRKRLARQLHEAQIVKYRNKETGQIVQKIQNVELIEFGYDYLRMADFKVLNAEGQGKVNKCQENQDILANLTELLKDKVLHGKNIQIAFDFVPQAFLRPYNLSVPTADLLANRLNKKKGQTQVKSQSISFGEQIPIKPDDLKSQPSSELHRKLVQCFKMRPCWLRNTLQFYLWENGFKNKYTITQLKNSLKYISYTFKDGPWKHTFCRFGYDPSLHTESAEYQVLLVKIKQKDLEDYQSASESGVEQEEGVPYDPTFKQIPTKFLRLYQIGDIKDERIQQRLQGVKVSTNACSKQFGWFLKKEYQQLHKIAKIIRQQKMN